MLRRLIVIALLGLLFVPIGANGQRPNRLATLGAGSSAVTGGGGSITFDAFSSQQANGVSSFSWSHTVASGGVLIVFASTGGPQTVTGVTYNSVAMTQLLATTDGSAGVDANNSAWVLHNPTTGSAQTVVVTLSGTTAGYGAGHAVSYTGVSNASAAATHRTIYNAGSGAGGGGVNVTVVDSQSGDLVISSISNQGAAITADHTSRGITQIFGSSYRLGTQDAAATGANTVMSWSSDDRCTHIAFALVPA